MGILDSLENSGVFKGVLGQLESAVIPVVLSEVLGNGGQGGGLSAIVAKLEQAGLGDQVKSWIGTGQNLPITAQQLQQVLGSDTVKQLGPASVFRSINSPRCWRNSSRPRSTMPARTAGCRTPPEGWKRGPNGRHADSRRALNRQLSY